jgi:very-short-patch-repair endonuclease
MNNSAALAVVSGLGAASLGAFTGTAAMGARVSRDQLTRMLTAGVIDRVHADVYRLTAVPACHEQLLHAALLWAPTGCADCRSAGAVYGLEGVAPGEPEIVVPAGRKFRSDAVIVRRVDKRAALMVRDVRGIAVTGPEATVLSLGRVLDPEALEIACEDARRRRLTSIPALRSYLRKYGHQRPGAAALRALLADVDPVHPARSTLEVKARRLLVAHGITDFVREFPLTWNGRTYRYDFAFPRRGVILETNGRRWHDDAADYEHDHEKWSVPGRLGYRIVLATWAKVTRDPHALLADLTATLAA